MPATLAVQSLPRSPRLSEDVLPFSEVRNNLASCIKRTHETHRPIVITQNGRATSVLADLADLEDWLETLAIREDVRVAEEQLARGEGIPHDQVMAELAERYRT